MSDENSIECEYENPCEVAEALQNLGYEAGVPSGIEIAANAILKIAGEEFIKGRDERAKNFRELHMRLMEFAKKEESGYREKNKGLQEKLYAEIERMFDEK